MAMEGWILQTSFAGLMPSSGASPLSNLADLAAVLGAPARVVAAQAAGQKPESFADPWNAPLHPAMFFDAVMRQGQERMETFVRGVRAYQDHPFRRKMPVPPAVWQRGVATLLDYGGPAGGPPALFVPSLINRAYIFDLAPDRSVLRSAAAAGLRAFLLDWGEPGDAERVFTVEDYIAGVLIPALEEVKARTGQTPRLVGYCMGGTLAVAPAVLRPDLVSALALLAAPWDFHAGTEASRVLLGLSRPAVEVMLAAEGCAPVDLLQAFFASLDPTLVGRKFRNFSALDPASELARRFVELEDWLNDGVPLAGPVAAELLFSWYGANDPVQGRWRIGDTVIDPAGITCPTYAVIPSQDRIVPPESARALADAIPNAKAHVVDLGHIGMVSGGSAPRRVYEPLIAWLKDPTTP